MRTPKALGKCIFVITMMIMFGCNQPYSQGPSVTNTPISPISLFATPQPFAAEFAEIDRAIRESITASITYNQYPVIKLNQTVTFELLLNPILEPSALATQITEGGQVITATIQITPRMKAELYPQEEDAFIIKSTPSETEQLISPTETTRWSWDVTAKKAGTHRLTLRISRLITVNGRDEWLFVDAYKSDINVEVTMAQRFLLLDWKWIAGLLITLVVVPALWRWIDQRKNQPEQPERLGQKRIEGPRNLTRETSSSHHPSISQLNPVLARLPRDPKMAYTGAENFGHIFISYRRSDSADIAGRIYDRLIDKFGREPIFKDVDSIPLGTDFKEYLDRKVSECNVLLAIIGDRWVDASDAKGKKRLENPDDFVRVEIESALERGIPVIPLLVRGAQMPDEETLPSSLRKLVYKNGIQIRHDPDFHHDMDRLISALDKYIRYWRRA